jgi:hypothetical protein
MLGNGHYYGSMWQIMEIIEYARKGYIMNMKENYYIYKLNNLIN